MVEQLSDPIRRVLLGLKLCSERDLRRCRSHVRRLAWDLPAFDSVWLDALVQIGRLTPYQARILESSEPERIRIGPCVAINQLGGGPLGRTLLARPHDGDELCVIKLLNSANGFSQETLERLQALVQAAKGLSHPSLVVPNSCAAVDNQLLLISRYVPGSHLGELLVRRGRFPAAIVRHIGRQLADGLIALSQRGIAHGDIRAANVRLTSAGTVALVDAGIRPAIDPVLTVHSGLLPERYDGIAPELIGVGGVPNATTDAYALGCLLWQLLAGRPPFPGGDPLVKLAAHQTRAIDDVRKWAPDTPDDLAEGIRRLTARIPADRPQSFTQLLNAWGEPDRKCRAGLRAFRRRFDAPSRNLEMRQGLSAPTRWLFALTALFAVSGGAAMLADQGARNVAQAWASQFSQRLGASARVQSTAETERGRSIDDEPRPKANAVSQTSALDSSNSNADAADELANPNAEPIGKPMPAPDQHGVIHLDSAGPYRPCDVTVVGELAIVGAAGIQPQILIDDQPVKLCAESLRLKNVRISIRPSDSTRPPTTKALLRVQAQELSVDDCAFEGGGGRLIANVGEVQQDDVKQSESKQSAPQPVIAPPTGPAALAWKLLDASEQRGGRASIRNTRITGDGPSLYLAHAVKIVEFNNVLKIGSGPLVQLAAVPAAKTQVAVRLMHTTCRASGALVRWIVVPNSPAHGRVVIEAGDCVFDIVSPRAALFELAGEQSWPEWLKSLRMTGEGSLTRPGLEVAAWVSTTDGRLAPLDSQALEVEGLFAGDFRFAGESITLPADSEVRDAEAPRRSSESPGIAAAALPGS